MHVDALGELTHAGGVPLAWDTADPTAPPVALGDQAVVGHGHPWALTAPVTVLDVDWRHTVGGGTDPWGQDAAGTGVGLGFRGELVVDGLVWLRARAYDPASRAFLTPDPLEPVLGTAFAANPYHYAGNDPVNQVDPLGLRPVTDAELAGEHDSGGGLFSKIGHGVLDVAGLVPGVGEVADLANAAWYTAEGDYTMAALSAAAAIPFAGWAATGAKAAIKGTAAAEKLTAKAVVEGAQGAKRAPDFIASADGTVIPTSRARLEGGFRDAGFPSAPTPKSPGVEYTLPSGTHVRVMEPSGQAPLRASFTNANGGPVGAFTDKPVQPPPGLDKPARLDIRTADPTTTTRVAELLDLLGQRDLLAEVVRRAEASDNPDVREVAEDFGVPSYPPGDGWIAHVDVPLGDQRAGRARSAGSRSPSEDSTVVASSSGTVFCRCHPRTSTSSIPCSRSPGGDLDQGMCRYSISTPGR